jgi:carboxyl-terminal processing protease
VLSVATAAAVRGQAVTNLDRERGRTMLQVVRSEIERRYYDPSFRGVDLAARAAELEQRIQQATTLADVLSSVAQLPLLLGDEHTFFVPPQTTTSVDYGWSMMMVGDSCFVNRVKAGSDAARQGVTPGDRVLTVNGYRPTRDNLSQILYVFHLLRPQRGLHVTMRSPAGVERELDLAGEVRQSMRTLDLTGADGGTGIAELIRAAEREADEYESRLTVTAGNVLVWKLPTFSVSEEVLADGRRRMRGRAGLVLDLRGNGGGSVGALLKALGMLNADSVVVGVQRERTRERRLVARGTGGDAFTGPVVVLVDSRSASASEVVARVLQLSRRGVVLGDRTAGAVMRAYQRSLSMGLDRAVFYGVSVTDAELVMSDGGRLERAGVEPDELILPSPAQMAAGTDPVLARALELVARPAAAR